MEGWHNACLGRKGLWDSLSYFKTLFSFRSMLLLFELYLEAELRRSRKIFASAQAPCWADGKYSKYWGTGGSQSRSLPSWLCGIHGMVMRNKLLSFHRPSSVLRVVTFAHWLHHWITRWTWFSATEHLCPPHNSAWNRFPICTNTKFQIRQGKVGQRDQEGAVCTQ